jgi:hypothetical protein
MLPPTKIPPGDTGCLEAEPEGKVKSLSKAYPKKDAGKRAILIQ